MSHTADHEDRSVDLACEAVGTLPPEEGAEVERYLESCVGCADEMGELRDAAALLATLVPPRTLHAATATQIRVRLLHRASSDRLGRPDPLPFPRRSARRVGAWSGWLVAAGLASLLLTHHAFHRPLAGGWVLAGILSAALVLLAVYAVRQRRENAELRKRVDRASP